GTAYPSFQDFGVVSADLNRDGLPDMAIAGGAIISVFLATSPGTFGAEADYSLPGSNNPNNLLAADFNGDGALDLIVGDYGASQLSILWNNGDGTFHNGPTLNLSAPATSFDLGDFNHDGLLDVATVECTLSSPTSCSMNVYLGKGNGAFTKSQSVHLAGPSRHVSVADMNGDGRPDLVISRTTQILLWWGKGDGTFSAPSYLTPTGQTDSVGSFAIADFNNDGKLDVVVNTGTNLSSFMGCVSGSSWSFKNTGGNNFSLVWTSPGGCADLDPIDLNGDLNEDLIYQNGDPNAGFFAGVLGNGDGTFRSTTQSFPNQGGGPLYVRDLNLDSRDDYIVGLPLGETMVALQTGGFKNCPPPSSASLAAKICVPAPGSSPGSPVLVRAAGNSPAGVIQLQVWIDGAKKAVKWHNQLAKKFSLSSGTHRITVVAADKYAGTVKKSVSVTVP
ncbi:MAG: hypothetical protein QOF94_1586, partial [Acidobacteriaceae bacterium]